MSKTTKSFILTVGASIVALVVVSVAAPAVVNKVTDTLGIGNS